MKGSTVKIGDLSPKNNEESKDIQIVYMEDKNPLNFCLTEYIRNVLWIPVDLLPLLTEV